MCKSLNFVKEPLERSGVTIKFRCPTVIARGHMARPRRLIYDEWLGLRRGLLLLVGLWLDGWLLLNVRLRVYWEMRWKGRYEIANIWAWWNREMLGMIRGKTWCIIPHW
jgi:hypothetical protein